MSYIKVNLGGQERGLKFNQISVEVYAKHLNPEALNSSSVYAMFFAGLEGNRTVKREEADYTFEQVCDWVEELYKNNKPAITEVEKVFTETNSYKDWLLEFKDRVRAIIDEQKTEEEKKSDKKKVSRKKK